ncbi:MAG: recombinase family protein [Faecalimonas sp.]|nr:recombinase family protein [Faecalimonas sp.]
MNAVIYARYSSDNQREESIEGQLRECKDFANKNDIQIVGTYIDRALSAKTDNRPDFQKMIKDSSSGNFERIIVWKLDRFARNRYDSAHYKSVLRKNGVKVISATEIISDTAEGVLLESLLEGMAEYYSADLSEKVIRGLTENALKCKFTGGTLPIGYTIDHNQMFQIDPLVAPAVATAFKHYAEGASMQEITDEMNLKGVCTKRGGKISVNSVTRMLHNRKYIGEYRYRNIVKMGGIPAIISEELFNQVQERMVANKKAPGKHKAEDEYLLTTKLVCGKCESYMVGESGTSHTKNKVYRYYKCVGVKYHKGCDKKSVKKEWIENLIIDYIWKVIFDDELIEMLTDQIMEIQEVDNTTLPLLRRQYADILRGIDNLLNAMQQGIITPSTKERLETLEREKAEISVQIIKEEMVKPTLSREGVIDWFNGLRKYGTNKLEHRRRLVDTFINKIILYDDDRIYIGCNYKDCSKTMTLAELTSIGIGSDISTHGAVLTRNTLQFGKAEF